LRSVFLGSVFLAVGMVDAFHTLSYKGMPAFLIETTVPTELQSSGLLQDCLQLLAFSYQV